MKKGIAILLALVLTLAMGISAVAEGGIGIALVTDVGNIDDQSFNQGTWEGVVAYAEAEGLVKDTDYAYYRPSEDSDTARVEEITNAIEKGAKVVVLPGYLFDAAVIETAAKFPEVMFLGVDLTPNDAFTPNINNIVYKEEIAGFCAGYAVVKDGYTKLGFLGGIDVPAVVRYGHGFVQGAEFAAAEMGIDAIEVKYWYSAAFWPTDEIKSKMDSWYAEGTEIVFSCGGGIYLSCLAAAEESGTGMLVGVDVDQGYISTRVVTSAFKKLPEAVKFALDQLKAAGGTWPAELGGKTTSYGAEEGFVGIPTIDASWRFATFTVAEYEAMYEKIKSGEIAIDDGIDAIPATTIVKVDDQN